MARQGLFIFNRWIIPKRQVALNSDCGDYRAGYQEVTFPRYTRYVADAADMAHDPPR